LHAKKTKTTTLFDNFFSSVSVYDAVHVVNTVQKSILVTSYN